MKRYLFGILILLFMVSGGYGQEANWKEGQVSFLSSKNVYVKFASTDQIEIGDSLYIKLGEDYVKAMVVDNKSSISTVCTPFANLEINKGDAVFASLPEIKEVEEPDSQEDESEEIEAEDSAQKAKTENKSSRAPKAAEKKSRKSRRKYARISAASYSNISDDRELHRLRYTFAYRRDKINDSRFSVDSYVTFQHTLGEWEEAKNDLARALRVYAFSVNYEIDSTSNITLGRKINPRTSSLGAIDGLQFEKRFGKVVIGGIGGTRPDHTNYSFNANLLQYGAYVSLASQGSNNFNQTTLGAIEQHNKGKIDRRFVYFQHSSTPLKNLNLFSSFEVDLYETINEEAHSVLKLTNFYLSLRYNLSRKWRFSASYDNRNNIIYYESYKAFIDRLVDQEARQGLRFGVNYQPFKLVNVGINSGWRFKKSDMNLTKNLNAYVNFSRIPVLDIRASINANFLETNYLSSHLFGLRLSRPIIRRRLDANLYFRIAEYRYKNTEDYLVKKIAGTSLSLRILNDLSLYLYYEGDFDNKDRVYHRFNTKLIQRF